ncbi:MAG TPA: c-type cytochrome biogenesis protein CcmI [Pyrinomonadaceae bacterium]|jgi:cytochrome c-type biogenesis protein CcmH
MILFWLICAGLVVIALAFVLPTLLARAPNDARENEKQEANVDVYRDQLSELEADLRNGIISQQQYQQDRDEIERRLLDDVSTADDASKKGSKAAAGRGPVYAVAFGIPVIAVALYLVVGNSAALSGVAPAASQARQAGESQGNGQMSQQQIEANIAALAKRLEQNSGDAEGWIMLGRSYTTLEKYTDATNAYAKAAALKTDDADLLADYAFAMAMANGRQLKGEPLELVKRALRLDPENAKALDLAASGEFQARNYKQAIDYWQKVLDKAPANSELAQRLSQQIDEAKTLAATSAK